jgi:F5/8 type C domain.
MTNIVPTSSFDDVPLLEKGDAVEGGIGGASNKQAIALANRDQFLDDKIDALQAADVNADKAGTAQQFMTSHEGDSNPHTQYLLKDDADKAFLKLSGANLPNGAVLLDKDGKIPTAFLDLIQSTYVIVADKAARLALPQTANLTIAVQADEDTLYYLNGGKDPSVEGNWVKGQAATVSGVSRVFGRTGEITAQAGDYNADQITETANKLFATPAEKQTWGQKQEKLVSGTNIVTLFGKPLLGAGNFAPTPKDMGAAAEKHVHPTSDITDFKKDVLSTVGSNLVPGKNMTLNFDATTGKITLAASLSSGGDDNSFTVVDKIGAIAGQQFVFNFAPQAKYNLQAFALKSIAGAVSQTYPQDTFAAADANLQTITSMLTINAGLSLITSQNKTTAADGSLYSAALNGDVISMNITGSVEKLITPVMTANNAPTGYTASASSQYDSGSPPWKAFDQTSSSTWISLNQPSSGSPQWVAIALPAAKKVTRYEVVNRLTGFINSPTAWTLQGFDGSNWLTLDTRSDTNNTGGAVRSYAVTNPGTYSAYRLMVTNCAQAGALTVGDLNLYSMEDTKFLLSNASKTYNVVNNALVEVTGTVDAAYITANGTSNAAITSSMLATLGTSFKVLTGALTSIGVNHVPRDQIALNKNLTNAGKWAKINSLTMTSTVTGTGKARLAVTKDLINYFVFDGSAWQNIGTLTADTTSATKLLNQGMTQAAVNAITADQWKLLLADSNGSLSSLAFAYALGSTAATDAVTIKSTMYNVDENGSWKLQSPTEVEINWQSDGVVFKTTTAGTYKFGYQIP